MKRVIQVFAAALCLLSAFGWWSKFYHPLWAGREFEMPLGALEGVAVDSDGNIYCASQFYSRVQK